VKVRLAIKHIPLLATVAVGALLYAIASVTYRGFFSAAVFINFFSDNAVLGITALGMTFVILSGGIDLSVGAVIGCTSIFVAILIQQHHLHPALAIGLALALGAGFGGGMGCLIRFYGLPPFLVTLAGMFLARGLGFVLRLESIPINHPFYDLVTRLQLPLGGGANIPATALIFLGALLIALYLAHWTRFGRNVYALGGDQQSALLMGLPVGSTKIGVYVLSGLCSALAGVVYTFYTFSGNPTAGTGRELDAIAAVVIGGTLLSGGVGYIAGTLVGLLIFGIIQTALAFQGTLSSWWTKIVVGLLLLFFILLQKIVLRKRLNAGGE
jgi:ribose/xylose/arabinose/galactoside ABC-type transport system permease subunit